MTKKLVEIQGIGATHAGKLEAIGVPSQEALLEAGATPKGRKDRPPDLAPQRCGNPVAAKSA